MPKHLIWTNAYYFKHENGLIVLEKKHPTQSCVVKWQVITDNINTFYNNYKLHGRKSKYDF